MRKQPHEEGLSFPRTTRDPISAISPVKGKSCFPSSTWRVPDCLWRHMSSQNFPAIERKKKWNSPTTQTPNAVESGVRTEQANLGITLEVASVAQLEWSPELMKKDLRSHLHTGKLRCQEESDSGSHGDLVTGNEPELSHLEPPPEATSRVLKWPCDLLVTQSHFPVEETRTSKAERAMRPGRT